MSKLIRTLLVASSCMVLAKPVLAQNAPIRMGQTSTMQAIEQTDAGLARQAARIGELEAALQQMTGRVETLEFRLQQTERLLEGVERDNRELLERLARLEGQVDSMSRGQMMSGSGAYPSTRPYGNGQSSIGPVQSDSPISTTRPSGPRELVGNSQQRVTTTIPERPTSQPAQTGSLGTIPATRLPEDAGTLFELGKNRLIDGDYKGSENAFRAYLDAYGDTPQSGEANYWLGEALYQQGDYAGSARYFTDLLKNYPDDALRGDSLVKLARSLREVGETDRACAFLERIDDVAPNAKEATLQRARQEQQRSGCN